jgi:hypothetical protein
MHAHTQHNFIRRKNDFNADLTTQSLMNADCLSCVIGEPWMNESYQKKGEVSRGMEFVVNEEKYSKQEEHITFA